MCGCTDVVASFWVGEVFVKTCGICVVMCRHVVPVLSCVDIRGHTCLYLNMHHMIQEHIYVCSVHFKLRFFCVVDSFTQISPFTAVWVIRPVSGGGASAFGGPTSRRLAFRGP